MDNKLESPPSPPQRHTSLTFWTALVWLFDVTVATWIVENTFENVVTV